MAISTLPFELSKQSITDWLHSLSQLNSASSANELNKVMQKLRKTDKEPKKILQTLTQLLPTILFTSNTIELSSLAEARTNQGKFSQKIVKLSIQLLRNTSLAFSNLSVENNLSLEEKNLTIYLSLQLIGLTQRTTTLFHESPSSALWLKTAELYLIAKKTELNQLEIKLKVKEFKTLPNIESVLQRNLLFSMFSPYQFNSDQIHALFIIAEQQFHFISFSQHPSENSFFWAVESGYPPVSQRKSQLEGIHINPAKLLSFLQSTTFVSEKINGEILSKVMTELSGFKIMLSSSTMADFTIDRLINGHENIFSYLNSIEKLRKIQQFSAQSPHSNNLSLDPIATEKSHLTPQTELTPIFENSELQKQTQTVKILQTKFKQFIVAIANDTSHSIGNIILLCNSTAGPQLGIIRQTLFVESTNATQLLIEKIKGSVSSVLISSSTLVPEQIILSESKGSNIDVFIIPCKLSNGTTLELSTERSITIKQLIDYSPCYMRYVT